jgi:hypothetical protein
MDEPREARPAVRKIANIFAARKFSSSTYNTNRLLPSGGRVLSKEELHLEPISTTGRSKKQLPHTLLK